MMNQQNGQHPETEEMGTLSCCDNNTQDIQKFETPKYVVYFGIFEITSKMFSIRSISEYLHNTTKKD